MNVRQAREYFELGIITYARIYRVSACHLPAGWMVAFYNENNEDHCWDLKTSKGTDRVFASLDTLIGVLEEMGMNCGEMEINFQGHE